MKQANIAMDLFSFFVIFSFLMFLTLTEKTKSSSRKSFSFLCIFAMLRAVFDAITYHLEGVAGDPAYYTNLVCTIILSILTFLLYEAFVVCIACFFNNLSHHSKNCLKVSFAIIACSILLVFIDIPFHFLYEVERAGNSYSRGSLFWLFFMFASSLLIICVIILLLERKNIKKSDKLSFIVFGALCFLGIFVSSFDLEIRFVCLFVTIAICLIGLRIQFNEFETSNTEKMVANLEARSLSEIYTGVCRYDKKKGGFTVRVSNERYKAYIKDGLFDTNRFVNEVVSSTYKNDVQEFLSKEKIDALFGKDDSAVYELEFFEKKYNTWRRMILIYKADSSEKQMFLLFHDINQIKKLQFETIEQTRRVISASKDLYADFMEWNLTSNKVIRLKFEKNGITEVPVQGEFVKAFKRFRDNNVLPEDLEAFACFSPQKLLHLGEEKIIMCNYRLRQNDEFRYILNNEDSMKNKYLGNVVDYRWHTTIARKTRDTNGEVIITFLTQDIEDSVKERLALKSSSEHDKLTELFNRTKYNTMLETEYTDLDSCGVLFFDVNYLKIINDEQGHSAGDVLIKSAADSLKYISGDKVHSYRYGGDEMIVVVCNGTKEEMDVIVDKWRKKVDEINETAANKLSMAVGMAWSNMKSVNDLVKEADELMYIDKKRIKEGKTS